MDACHPTFIVQSKISVGKSPHHTPTTATHTSTCPPILLFFHCHHPVMLLPLHLLSQRPVVPIRTSRATAGVAGVLLRGRSELSAPCVFSDPRLHHLSGCAGLAQGHGLPQHHAVRVTACPGHLSPLHRLLSHTQSEYREKQTRSKASSR